MWEGLAEDGTGMVFHSEVIAGPRKHPKEGRRQSVAKRSLLRECLVEGISVVEQKFSQGEISPTPPRSCYCHCLLLYR